MVKRLLSVEPIPVTGPEGPSMSLVLSWELAFYEISVASQNHVEVVIFPILKNCHMRFYLLGL